MSVVSLETETGEILSGDVIQEFTEDEARRHIDKVRGSVTVTAELVIEAWERRAWKALGYRTWEDLLEAEFPDIGMNQSARQVLMVGLRNAGMSLRGIAKTTGASRNTVRGQVGQIDPPDTVGTDGKTYTRSESHSVTETITDGEPVAGESGTGDGPAMSSGGPSPAFDPGEAALGDDADTPSPFPSPGSPIDVEPPQEAPSTPVEADGTARPDASTGPRTVALAARELAKASQFFAMFSPDDIHELNDPEVTATVEYLIAVARNWANEFEATQPHGLTVIEGGRQ